MSSDSLPEAVYLAELRRLKKETLEACVQTEALREELRPESLIEDRDLSELLGELAWELEEAWTTAKRAHTRVELLLAIRGHPLDSRDQYERDID
jgi:hypothetical protein